jgi:small neutral amino acid transporter SnatA (MarC family)
MLDMARRRRWIDRIVSFASKDKLFEIEYSHILIIIIIFYAYVLCYLIKILSKLYGRQVGRRAYGPIRS